MNKKGLATLILILLAIVAVILTRSGDENQNSNLQNVLSEPTANIELASPQEAHPVSLPALMEKQYDGRDLKLDKILNDNQYYTRYFITYKSGELTISGIMNIPKGNGPFPVLVLNHGYIDPAIYTNGRGLRREQDYLARNGYAVIHPDYRNHAQSSKDDTTESDLRIGYVIDVINAVYAVRAANIPKLDTQNIGMLGHSMGGGVTINLVTVQPDLIKAAVLFAPVSADQKDNFERWTKTRPQIAAEIIDRFGEPSDTSEFWKNISAVNFLDRIKVPILLHHGTADKDVPVAWSDTLEKNLKAAGKQIVYRVYPGQPHEFTTDWPKVMKDTLEFYNQYLK